MQEDCDPSADDEREPTAADVEWRHSSTLLAAEESARGAYPSVHNLAAGTIFGGLIRPVEPKGPDYVATAMEQPPGDGRRVGMWICCGRPV